MGLDYSVLVVEADELIQTEINSVLKTDFNIEQVLTTRSSQRKTQQKPGDGSTHWSCRKLAQALGLSKSTVQRVWTQMRLKPHRLDRYQPCLSPRKHSS